MNQKINNRALQFLMSETKPIDFLLVLSNYTHNCQISQCFCSVCFRWGSWEMDSEMEICVHDFTGQFSEEQLLGIEEGKVGKREKSNCQAMTTEASVNCTTSSESRARVCTHSKQVIGCQMPLERGHSLGQGNSPWPRATPREPSAGNSQQPAELLP